MLLQMSGNLATQPSDRSGGKFVEPRIGEAYDARDRDLKRNEDRGVMSLDGHLGIEPLLVRSPADNRAGRRPN